MRKEWRKGKRDWKYRVRAKIYGLEAWEIVKYYCSCEYVKRRFLLSAGKQGTAIEKFSCDIETKIQ